MKIKPKCQSMIDYLVKFDEVQVINALKELNDELALSWLQLKLKWGTRKFGHKKVEKT